MARFVAGAVVVAIATRYLAYEHHLGAQSTRTLNTLADSVLGRIDNFALGMAAATMFARGYRGVRPAVGAAAAFALFTGSAWLWDGDSAFGAASLRTALGGYLMANVAFFMLLGAALRSEGLLARVLSFAPLRAAGIGCYSIYLVHAPLLLLLDRAPRLAEIPVYWGLTAILSYGTYRLVEERGILAGRRRARG